MPMTTKEFVKGSFRPTNIYIFRAFVASLTVFVGVMVLIGYFIDYQPLYTPIDTIFKHPPSTIGMSPTTALCLILLGAERAVVIICSISENRKSKHDESKPLNTG
jgi:hypothetical protein